MVTATGCPVCTRVRSVSFMLASIQCPRSATSPTALVVEKADMAEMISVPGCREPTAVTMPSNGARTTVWSICRLASSIAARAFISSGKPAVGRSGLPPRRARSAAADCRSESRVATAER